MSDQPSSNDTTASSELKAGHAPATKVGGMRVGAPRPRHSSHGEDKNAATENTEEKSGEDVAQSETTNENAAEENADTTEPDSTAVANRAAGEMVSGVFVPIDKAYPTEAVKHIHDKPGTHPKNEYYAHSKQNDARFINQPRKQ